MYSLVNYYKAHKMSIVESVQQLSGTPIRSLLSIFIISFAFVLPTGVWVFTKNMSNLISMKDPGAKLNAFFIDNDTNKQSLINEYSSNKLIKSFRYNSSSDNANLLQQHLDNIDIEAINSFTTLPASIVFYLADDIDINSAKNIKQSLDDKNFIEHTQLDMEWLKKWQAIISLFKKSALLLTTILSIGAIFIISNLTKSAIDQQRDIISVKNLLGASQPFIRRDFLYMGFWRGFFSGVVTIIIIQVVIISLSSNFHTVFIDTFPSAKLIGLSFKAASFIIISSSIIGIIGSWIAYNSHHRLLLKER